MPKKAHTCALLKIFFVYKFNLFIYLFIVFLQTLIFLCKHGLLSNAVERKLS